MLPISFNNYGIICFFTALLAHSYTTLNVKFFYYFFFVIVIPSIYLLIIVSIKELQTLYKTQPWYMSSIKRWKDLTEDDIKQIKIQQKRIKMKGIKVTESKKQLKVNEYSTTFTNDDQIKSISKEEDKEVDLTEKLKTIETFQMNTNTNTNTIIPMSEEETARKKQRKKVLRKPSDSNMKREDTSIV